jgi:hypothetical protein
MTLSRGSRLAVLLLLILGCPHLIRAQDAPPSILGCDVYESCALRVQYRFFRNEVVRGPESTSVTRIGLGTPPLEELFARSDSALVSFHEFRKDHIRSSWLMVLGGLEFVGSLVAEANGKDDLAVGLSIGGIVLEVIGAVFRTKADEHMSKAIWWHNESLAAGPIR